MAGAKFFGGILGILAIAACQDNHDGWNELADGSFLNESRYNNGPLIQGDRCWPSEGEFDCVRIRRFEPPTILIARYRVPNLMSSGQQSAHFGCLFDANPDEWFAQIVSNGSIRSQRDSELTNRVPKNGPKMYWSKNDVAKKFDHYGLNEDLYLECRELYKSIILVGSNDLLRSDLLVRHFDNR